MCQPCWCASAAKTSSSGLGALVVISKEDSFSSILGTDMYWACCSVHGLMCAAAFCFGVGWKTRRQSVKSATKVDLIPMVHIMRQCATLGSGAEASAGFVAKPDKSQARPRSAFPSDCTSTITAFYQALDYQTLVHHLLILTEQHSPSYTRH